MAKIYNKSLGRKVTANINVYFFANIYSVNWTSSIKIVQKASKTVLSHWSLFIQQCVILNVLLYIVQYLCNP
jgi:hypothetical protein